LVVPPGATSSCVSRDQDVNDACDVRATLAGMACRLIGERALAS
jgi:hypothetical protein